MKLKTILILYGALIFASSAFSQADIKSELRSTWIASVSNLDWPNYEHRNQPELQMADLDRMLTNFEALNFNAVFLQVRPECDALYNSAYEPWSRYLTWAQGDDPGYDPLQFAIEAAHEHGIELHVWLNPYRINASTNDGGNYYHSSHVYSEHPDWAIEYSDGKKILNPGLPEVMTYIGQVVRDLVSNYHVDGVHFDDYFYSYDGTPNSLDQDEYDLYGGDMSRADWRRDNVNRMIDTVYRVIQEVDPDVRFGVSPFGIYRPGVPSGITGLDAYNVIYCDPVAWLEDQRVDYLTPQLYWPTGGGQDFETLIDWWAAQVFEHNRHVYAGHGTYRLDSDPGVKTDTKLHELKKHYNFNTENFSMLEKGIKEISYQKDEWNLDQIGLQIDLVRENRDNNAFGSVYFRADDFDRVNGLAEYIVTNKYTHSTIMPEMTWKNSDEPMVPENLHLADDSLKWDYTGAADHRFAIYISNESSDSAEIVANPMNLFTISFRKALSVADLSFSSESSFVITAVSATGKEGDPSQSYTIETNLPTVDIVSPTEGAMVGVNDTLKWNSSDTEATFYVEISTDFSFGNVVYSSDWIENSYLLISDLNLDGELIYFWRVKAKTTMTGPYCLAASFFTGYPEVPEIIYPVQLDNNVSILPVIDWSSSIAAESIRIQISESISFDVLVVDEILAASQGQGQINTMLEQETWYNLRISAINEYGESGYSNTIAFETTAGIIPDVTMLSPSDGATVASFDMLSWQTSVTDVTVTFLLEVALDEDFTTVLYNSGWTDQTEIEISAMELEGNRTYYWHMKAKSEDGESYFTESRSFVTGYPTRPTITEPPHLASGISVKAEVGWEVDENTDSVYVEFSEASDYSSIYIAEQFDASADSATIQGSLRGNTWYYVHLSAQNEYGYSIFSYSRHFETGEGNAVHENGWNDDHMLIYQDESNNLVIKLHQNKMVDLNINIYDILGKTIYTKRHTGLNCCASTEFVVTKDHLNYRGIYMVQIQSETVQKTQKIFIR